MPLILYGKPVRDKIAKNLSDLISNSSFAKPTLAIIQIGKDARSEAYINQKKQFGKLIGAEIVHFQLSEKVSEKELSDQIKNLNDNQKIHGIILQLPIPASLEKQKLIDLIDPSKDVDGLNTINQRLLASGDKCFIPATGRGIFELLNYYDIKLRGKKAVVMGRSRLVGSPIAKILSCEGAIVEVVHSQTANPKEITKTADLLIVAIGKPALVDDSYLKSGAIVIDIGINPVGDDSKGLLEEIPKLKLVGDVAFEKVKNIVSAISPVPGGVGPMTVAALFENLCDLWQKSCKNN